MLQHHEIKQIERELKNIERKVYFVRMHEKVSIQDARELVRQHIIENRETIPLMDFTLALEYLDRNRVLH